MKSQVSKKPAVKGHWKFLQRKNPNLSLEVFVKRSGRVKDNVPLAVMMEKGRDVSQ